MDLDELSDLLFVLLAESASGIGLGLAQHPVLQDPPLHGASGDAQGSCHLAGVVGLVVELDGSFSLSLAWLFFLLGLGPASCGKPPPALLRDEAVLDEVDVELVLDRLVVPVLVEDQLLDFEPADVVDEPWLLLLVQQNVRGADELGARVGIFSEAFGREHEAP